MRAAPHRAPFATVALLYFAVVTAVGCDSSDPCEGVSDDCRALLEPTAKP
jgi:hypothetical protein